MQVYNINYEEIFDKETCLPELDSPSFNPVFNFRRELRKDHIDPTSIVLLTVVTIDKATNDTRIVGYAAVPLFITAGPNPVHPSVQNVPVRLLTARYAFSHFLSRTTSSSVEPTNCRWFHSRWNEQCRFRSTKCMQRRCFSMNDCFLSIDRRYELEKLPCASILVRIVSAPMDDKGLRALSINDFTD